MESYLTHELLSWLSLEDSYVLSVNAEVGTLRIKGDWALARLGDGKGPLPTVFKTNAENLTGQFVYPDFSELRWTRQFNARPSRDASGELDYGDLDGYIWESGHHQFEGSFGLIEVWFRGALRFESDNSLA